MSILESVYQSGRYFGWEAQYDAYVSMPESSLFMDDSGRRSFLRGIMDVGGYIDTDQKTTLLTISETFCTDFVQLIESFMGTSDVFLGRYLHKVTFDVGFNPFIHHYQVGEYTP